MKYYHSYMNRQEISPEVHGKLLSLEPPAKARRSPWAGVAALAACCALVVGLALWRGGSSAPTPPPVLPGAVSSQEVPFQSNEAFQSVTVEPNDSQNLMLPMIPYINYQESDTAMDVASSIALAEGSFSRDLTQEQIQAIFWGPEADHVNAEQGGLPWMLFWEGYDLSGYVIYSGGGELFWLHLFGEHPDGPSLHLQLALDRLPPTCCLVNSGLETTEVFGTEVVGRRMAYDRNGDEVTDYICTSEFMAGNVGVRFENVGSPFQAEYGGSEEMAMGGACQLNALFVRQALIADGGLYLDHLAHTDDVPQWRDADFDNLAQAREEADFAPYLPQEPIPGYGEFRGRMTYQEGHEHVLWVRWSRGYDDVSISVYRPEGESWWGETVDVSNPAGYDTRLYTIPWSDSVPQEYRDNFYSPHFRAEDMSLDIVKARGTEKDTGGMAYRFGVIHPGNILVKYDCSLLTAEEVWALVEATLP